MVVVPTAATEKPRPIKFTNELQVFLRVLKLFRLQVAIIFVNPGVERILFQIEGGMIFFRHFANHIETELSLHFAHVD